MKTDSKTSNPNNTSNKKPKMTLSEAKRELLDPDNINNLSESNSILPVVEWMNKNHPLVKDLIIDIFWYNVGANLFCFVMAHSETLRKSIIASGTTPEQMIIVLMLLNSILVSILVLSLTINFIKWVWKKVRKLLNKNESEFGNGNSKSK